MADTVRTQTEILALLANNTTGAISEQDIRDTVVSARANQGGGWALYTEGTAITQGTAQTITGDARTLLLNNAGGRVITTQLNDMTPAWVANKVRVELDCFYDLRLTFQSQIASGTGGHYLTTELDIGGSVGVVWAGTHIYAKGAATQHAFQFSIPIFAGSDFVSNGGEFYVTADTNADIWGMTLLINRTYVPDN